jgi:alkanesulfonate monooxygenase SsuD/methylene tetrahydromethanopterin reductase-like flavin-dependent oxidoreductase (luciferase family)
MKVGLMLPLANEDEPPGWTELRGLAEAAEAGGLDSVWVADHFLAQSEDGAIRGVHDGWTLLAAP